MAEYSIRNRQESTESLDSSSAVTSEDYSDDDKEKDRYDIEDFNIIKTIENFKNFGSVKARVQRKKPIVDDEDIEIAVLGYFAAYPTISLRQVARESGLSKNSVQRILRKHKFHPYKFSIVQHLKETDFPRRVRFCEFVLTWSQGNELFLDNIIWTDEAEFTKNGVFNRHNCHYRSDSNQHVFRELNFQESWKSNVYCAIRSDSVVALHFYQENLNGTGTFGRVVLCKNKETDEYGAMKILCLADVIRLKQVEHVKNEKNILQEVRHPFVVNMLWCDRDESCIYMLFEYVCGGELFSYLRNAGRFTSSTGNFYSSEIVSALEYLHSKSIVYRDLKPENLLLDKDGHLKITDFGFAKKLTDRTWTLCGTPEYLAPEIIQSKGHNKAVDWWALGVLIYEMLAGYPPFYDDNPFGIYEKILSGKIEWPKHLDTVAKDLIKKLLVQDRTKRLGNMKSGAEDIKRHRWFKGIDWHEVYTRKLTPPFVPKIMYDGDASNFDDYPEVDWKSSRTLEESELKLFEDF